LWYLKLKTAWRKLKKCSILATKQCKRNVKLKNFVTSRDHSKLESSHSKSIKQFQLIAWAIKLIVAIWDI